MNLMTTLDSFWSRVSQIFGKYFPLETVFQKEAYKTSYSAQMIFSNEYESETTIDMWGSLPLNSAVFTH